ncbi:MAG: ABC transporter permease, partial [Pseudomonadota bacterium]
MIILIMYAAIFLIAMFGYKMISARMQPDSDYTSLKTVTFGDESAVTPNRAASIISIITIFLIWGSFTGSKLIPSFLHMPGPFVGETSFDFQATDASGNTDDGSVSIVVHYVEDPQEAPAVEEDATGLADNVGVKLAAWRSVLISSNDLLNKDLGEDVKVTSVNGTDIGVGDIVDIGTGTLRMTDKGSLSYLPNKGWQMEEIWLPAPESVVGRLIEISRDGYQNVTLAENLGWS